LGTNQAEIIAARNKTIITENTPIVEMLCCEVNFSICYWRGASGIFLLIREKNSVYAQIFDYCGDSAGFGYSLFNLWKEILYETIQPRRPCRTRRWQF
jgi:hypothetical protein